MNKFNNQIKLDIDAHSTLSNSIENNNLNSVLFKAEEEIIDSEILSTSSVSLVNENLTTNIENLNLNHSISFTEVSNLNLIERPINLEMSLSTPVNEILSNTTQNLDHKSTLLTITPSFNFDFL